jgi:hypothetical protein
MYFIYFAKPIFKSMQFIYFEITRILKIKIKNWRKNNIVNIFIHNFNLNVTKNKIKP